MLDATSRIGFDWETVPVRKEYLQLSYVGRQGGSQGAWNSRRGIEVLLLRNQSLGGF